MIYRLATGAQSALKQRIITGAFVLAVTTGFPVLGAWLNYENLRLDPTNVAQEQAAGGNVLGESTTNNPRTGDDGSNEYSHKLNVRDAPQTQAALDVPQNAKPVSSAQTITGTVPTPTPTPDPEDMTESITEETVEEQTGLGLQDLLDLVGM